MRRTLGGEAGTKGRGEAAKASIGDTVKAGVTIVETGTARVSGALGTAGPAVAALASVEQQLLGAARRPGSEQQPWASAAVGIGHGHTQSAASDTA
jgi:hypothetical protein